MIVHDGLTRLIARGAFALGPDGIYSAPMPERSSDQQPERELRERIASQQYEDHLATIARNHSVPVMDREVDLFLRKSPKGALVLDIGGCWGWHWRRLAATRPDVGVVIIDFVRANLRHAREVLGPLVGTQVVLMHADATSLPFWDATAEAGFDGVWTVQVFQHIPDFARACGEAARVLKPGGRFVNYSLQPTPLVRAIYRVAGKSYHTEGQGRGAFHLARASEQQRERVADIIGGGKLEGERYTECLFHPDLRLTFAGKQGSVLGRIDSRLGDLPGVARWIARQRSFEAIRS